MGRARLYFGNCGKDGRVNAYLNDVELKFPTYNRPSSGEYYVDFDFQDKDVLKITGDEGAIIQFIDLKFIWCSHKSLVCDTNPHANDLKGSKSDSVPQWTFTDITRGPWNKNQMLISLGCPKESWCGFNYPGSATISTTLYGEGKAILDFGNLYKKGNVIAYRNYVELKDFGPKKTGKVVFDFQDGDVVRITEKSESWTSAVIQFNNLDFITCSSEPGKLFFQL